MYDKQKRHWIGIILLISIEHVKLGVNQSQTICNENDTTRFTHIFAIGTQYDLHFVCY